MLLCVLAVIFSRNLFACVIILSIYSLLAASLFVVMDAVDVAFTEAAVGAGISTLLMLAALLRVRQEREQERAFHAPALAVAIVLGALLAYGLKDLPAYGSADAPIHKHPITATYLKDSVPKIGVPNVVTAVLASYRGYDTLGETTVIFCAGIGVLILLAGLGVVGRSESPDQPS